MKKDRLELEKIKKKTRLAGYITLKLMFTTLSVGIKQGLESLFRRSKSGHSYFNRHSKRIYSNNKTPVKENKDQTNLKNRRKNLVFLHNLKQFTTKS